MNRWHPTKRRKNHLYFTFSLFVKRCSSSSFFERLKTKKVKVLNFDLLKKFPSLLSFNLFSSFNNHRNTSQNYINTTTVGISQKQTTQLCVACKNQASSPKKFFRINLTQNILFLFFNGLRFGFENRFLKWAISKREVERRWWAYAIFNVCVHV